MTSKEAFEWCCTNRNELMEDGVYIDNDVQQRWIGWEVATAYMEGQVMDLKRRLERFERISKEDYKAQGGM